MTPDRATLRHLAIHSHLVARALTDAYHADLAGDDTRAADRYGAALAGLRRLVRMAAEDKGERVWAEEE